MRRRRRGTSEITVPTSHYDEDTDVETDIDVECEVTPGEAPTGPTYDCAGTPGCGPEVEILSALDSSGKDWTEEINADRDWLARVEEKAIEAFGEPGDDDSDWRERRAW